MTKQWYKKLFENYSLRYQEEPYVHGTLQEVEFIEKEIGFNKGTKILDVGCGIGRHSIELGKRGYSVTGIDLSQNMLDMAVKNSKEAGLDNLTFLQMDAVKMKLDKKFDLAIMLCEGAFPLMETDEKNFKILKNISRALNPGARLIMTTLNALFVYTHRSNPSGGGEHLDLVTSRLTGALQFKDNDGKNQKIKFNERYYTPSEMGWLLKQAGFKDIEIFHGEPGNFTREKEITFDSFEILIVAKRR
ncbi:MAG: methyltransferase domain-containing protein [bacterium]|nr:methyltransferase domain-containing protein [bacterium]